jgi:hypothetical protein
MPRTLTAWVRLTVLRNVPSALSTQIAIWARSVGVNVKASARSSAARAVAAAPTTAPRMTTIATLPTRDITPLL